MSAVCGRECIIYYFIKNTLQLGDRGFCRNSSMRAVCDTSIARITGCVSTLRCRSASPLGTTAGVAMRVIYDTLGEV